MKAQCHSLSCKLRPALPATLITYESEVVRQTCTDSLLHTRWAQCCTSRLVHVTVEVKLIVVAMLVPPGNYILYCSTHPWHDWWTVAKECEVSPSDVFFFLAAGDRWFLSWVFRDVWTDRWWNFAILTRSCHRCQELWRSSSRFSKVKKRAWF